MSAIGDILGVRLDTALNALKESATRDRTAVSLVDQAVDDAKASAPAPTSGPRGTNLDIVV